MADALATPDLQFDSLLDYLKRTRGFDFSAYKRASLMRRIEKRMRDVNIERFADYTDYLEVHPGEFAQLFNVLLINVTEFFRDQPAWAYLRDEALPLMLAARDASEPIRVWSAGCSSGEEPFSIAMLLAELIGREQFRQRVKLYATDADEGALNQARAASYTEKQVEAVPPKLLDAYFTREGDRFLFDKDLRRSVIFGRHDLVQDAPISRVSLLICRNTLMYFNAEAQSRILARFHFAIADGGLLFLGRAEMLLTHSQMFAPLDLRRRVFRKVAKDNWRDRLAIMNLAGGDAAGNGGDHAAIYSAAFDAGANAQIVVDAAGSLSLLNERARSLFNIVAGDIGRPIQDLDLSYRPVELQSLIGQALDERREIARKDVEWAAPGRDSRYVDVSLTPLFDGGGKPIAVSVTFTDVSRLQALQQELHRSKQDLETAYEELQSTNEELETTNEELQSTVEELETTNEELQSTNEELETMNEELQSTNDELQTLNGEVRRRSEELNRANGFLQSVLAGVRSGVVVLDRELRVIAWNHGAEALWGLRADEARQQNFLNLDIGLPTDQLRAGIRTCLNRDREFHEVVVAATNRRGKAIACRIWTTPLLGGDGDVCGVILMMDEQDAAAPRAARMH